MFTTLPPMAYLPDETKKYIRSVVHDEINRENFWRDIFGKLQVDSQVSNYLNSHLPSQVHNSVNHVLPNMVSNKVNEILPGLVSQQLQLQLQNNSFYNNIFDKHSQRLNSELEVKSNEILDKVVNDDKYHVLTKLHLESMRYKNDNLLSELKTKANLQEKQLNEKLENLIKEKTNTIDHLENDVTVLKTLSILGIGSGVCYMIYKGLLL